MKIITVIGARPQFIKAAAFSKLTKELPFFEEIIIHTGQHFDKNMSEIFFGEMEIPLPKYNLNISSLNHGAMTGRMLEKIEEILLIEKPDIVLVYGDTNSTLAGALAASKLHIPVAHIEAGLRSFNMKMPEEINRILTDHVSKFLFCPTEVAVNNLKKEGIFESEFKKVVLSGDIMKDAAMCFKNKEKKPLELQENINSFALATIHRAENTDNLNNLTNIINALNEINKIIPIIVPLHPRTKQILDNSSLNCEFQVIKPVGYLEMLYLLNRANIVLTDSGGLQKEAYFFKKPCITLRKETEWVELVTHGYNIVAGGDANNIMKSFFEMKEKKLKFDSNLYGNGVAAQKIIDCLSESKS